MLCDLLTRTGVAGVPESYFRRESVPYWVKELTVPLEGGQQNPEVSPQITGAYLDAIKKVGTSANGVFAARVMWESLPTLLCRLAQLYPDSPDDQARLRAAFDPLRFIYLSRQNKLGQAASLAKALQSGLWHRNADGSELERLAPEQPASGYSFELMDRCYRESCADDRAWQDWFEQQGISPLCLTYEALATDPQGVTAKTLTYLGLDPAIADKLSPGTAKLADDESRAWIARYRREKGLA